MLPPAKHDLEDCLDRIDRLGVFPEVAQRILDVSQRPDSTFDELEKVVASDPVLSVRVLQIANSPLYGLQSRVGTLRRAVLMIGLEGTRALAFALAVSALGARTGPTGRDIYDHALVTAAIVRLLAPHVPGVHGGLLYSAALVHDLGLQLLLMLEPKATEEMLQKLGHNAKLASAERLHFGFDHAALGAAGLRRWGLPEPAAELVERHHEAPGGKPHRSVALLQIADHVAEGLMEEDVQPEDLANRGRWHPMAGVLNLDDEVWNKVAFGLPDVLLTLA